MRSALLSKWAGPVSIVVTGIAMLWWSWGTWPDVVVDFGKELYIPWQLVEGKRLYADIAHYKGPFSPYLNSVWFRLFGVSLRTLVLCNLLILTGTVMLLYRLFARISDRFSAIVACLIFVMMFAFSQYVGYGNYNYVCPYSHDMVHGLVLSLAAIYCLSVYQMRKTPWAVAGTGVALGLAFLTKAELFAAAALSVGTALTIVIWQERLDPGRALVVLACFSGGAIVPPLAAFGLLSLVLPAKQALFGVTGSWPWSLNATITASLFHQRGMGLENAAANAAAMALWTARYGLVFIPVVVLAFVAPRLKLSSSAVATTTGVIVAMVLGDRWQTIPWLEAAKPLPLVLLALGAVTLMRLRAKQEDARTREGLTLRLTLVVLAASLLSRMILNARVYHYGFVLAMPATLLLVVALVKWVPDWINRRGGDGIVFRAGAVGALLVVVIAHLQIANMFFKRKIFRVGHGADSFLADARGLTINMAVEEISRRLGPGETLAVVPEGLVINYLARRANPTPFVEFTPSVLMFGEDQYLASYRANPPDYLVWLYRDMTEFGFGSFEEGYGRPLWDWMQQDYRVVEVIRDPRLPDPRYNVLLWERKKAK